MYQPNQCLENKEHVEEDAGEDVSADTPHLSHNWRVITERILLPFLYRLGVTGENLATHSPQATHETFPILYFVFVKYSLTFTDSHRNYQIIIRNF